MERITVEVDVAIAKAWRNSSPSLRAKYENKIIEILRELKEIEFNQLLDKVGNIAAKNGLTEEKVKDLLNGAD